MFNRKQLFALASIIITLPLFMHQNIQCASTRSRSNFFEDIMGVTEKNFKSNAHNIKQAIKKMKKSADQFLPKYPEKEILILTNLKKPDTTYQAGYFEELALQDLYEATKNINTGGGTFNVIERVDGDTKPVDIGAMQADSRYKDAVFQVASNFNGLEFTGKSGHEMQNLEAYIYDHTQGPFAAISAAPGLIQRQYYAYYDSKEPNAFKWAQRFKNTTQGIDERQINFLDQTDIPTTNGYVDFSKKKPNQLTFQPIDYRKIKVGFQGATQATFGHLIDFKTHEVVTDPNQVINQVLTAAVDYTGNNRVAGASAIAKAILKAAYEGTLRAAALKGKKKVVLTLIGGGVFQNDFTWLQEAITAQKDLIQQLGLDVTLIIFNSSIPGQIFLKSMENMVKETGGFYIRHSKKNPTSQIIVRHKKKTRKNEITEHLDSLALSLKNLMSTI